jgi:hypothetical protein
MPMTLSLLTAFAPFPGPGQSVRAEDPAEQAVAHVRKLGGSVVRDEKRPGKPVVRVSLAFKAKVTDEDLKVLAPLTELTELDLQSTGVTSAGLKHLARSRTSPTSTWAPRTCPAAG